MSSFEMKKYIEHRNGELCMDEILHVIDTSRNPQIDHILYENGLWKLWDKNGYYFEFRKRNW